MTQGQIQKIRTARINPGSTDCIKMCVEIYQEETGLELSAILQTKLSDIIDTQVGKETTKIEQIVEALDGLINLAPKS